MHAEQSESFAKSPL